jgi:hypothetical protein
VLYYAVIVGVFVGVGYVLVTILKNSAAAQGQGGGQFGRQQRAHYD